MKNQKGEIVLGVVVISFMLGVFSSVIIPSAYYDANKADGCPEYVEDTTKGQRQICYAEKAANDVGMTLQPKA